MKRKTNLQRARLTRRSVLRTAAHAGVGAAAIALVGCSGDDDQQSMPQAAAQQPSSDAVEQQAAAQQPRQTSAAAESGATGTVRRIADEVPDAVDPLDWRQRFHWTRLAELSGQRDGPARGGNLRIQVPWYEDWTPFSERPATFGNPYGSLLPLVYSQLVAIDADDFTNPHRPNVTGDLASGWEWPDPTTVVFSLHRGVRWPDEAPVNGRDLTAEDVRVAHEALRAEGRWQAAKYDAVERIEADDANHTIAFQLHRPAAYLLNEMTSPLDVIVPAEAIVDPELIPSWRKTVGTGPFTLTDNSALGTWTLTRNPTYFKQDPATGAALPYLDQVQGFDFLRLSASTGAPTLALDEWAAGRVESIQLSNRADAAAALDVQPDAVQQVTPPTPGAAPWLSFRSLDSGPYADPRVRAALSQALDRPALAADLYDGLAAPDTGQNWAFVADHSTDWGFREWPWEQNELGTAYQFDTVAANSLLAAAGFSGGAPLTITIDAPAESTPGGGPAPFDPHGRVVDAVAAQWERSFGSAVRIERAERAWTQEDLGNGLTGFRLEINAEAAILYQPGFAYGVDPDEPTYQRMHSASTANLSGINDADIDRWSVAQRETTEASERSDLLERIRTKESEAVWRLFLVNPYGLAVRREYVFNLGETYFSKEIETLPKQLERVWLRP